MKGHVRHPVVQVGYDVVEFTWRSQLEQSQPLAPGPHRQLT